ncbi:uncharacterized protein [Gossypium hirsutum]|uniref:CCHC-type domain-containing protein n=1 Tax=Gossypium hirsutum TaxID=3635 RepID=A0ABM2Z6F9_GOSHI|nr:uncharacterized protein LOC107888787 [Gossypium hirsutum]XP_040937624.1 uncharacterized protein LOC107888787 [Gossypium hirsutum]XP_040937625.1 uncharacterized protein LOC107888787 [Gossypium hirsutum]XP_040937626.1 uncharacterized protein LOC107888787 [Gossypium hirsutum]XP_040937627.1 uncharacterized protein LOC107888787 [Gossypium hirsutum]XP_040937628.1 uncharacterized protein LOC107888787 [Gossypium hirsutum]
MSTRATRERGRGRGRGSTQAGSSSSKHIPTEVARSPPVDENGPYDRAAGDDALSRAMLRVLERVAGANIGPMNRGSISERFRANGAEVFGGISRVAPNVAEYWLEATERIIDDLNCTVEQKLKGAVSLLRDEACPWWITVREGTPAERVTWELFKQSFKAKYVGASYVDARRKEFLNLTQGGKTIAKYEAEFLRLSRYASGIVSTEFERSVRFEDGLRNELMVLVAPQRERNFAALVEKAKIAEEVKQAERKNCDRDRNQFRRDVGPTGAANRNVKRARMEELIRAVPVNTVRPQACGDCGRMHLGECWKRSGACLRCGSEEHKIKDCPRRPAQAHVVEQRAVQPVQPARGGPPPSRGRGQGRGGNGHGRGAPGRGTVNTEARQPALVYAARRREEGDAPDVIIGTFFYL